MRHLIRSGIAGFLPLAASCTAQRDAAKKPEPLFRVPGRAEAPVRGDLRDRTSAKP